MSTPAFPTSPLSILDSNTFPSSPPAAFSYRESRGAFSRSRASSVPPSSPPRNHENVLPVDDSSAESDSSSKTISEVLTRPKRNQSIKQRAIEDRRRPSYASSAEAKYDYIQRELRAIKFSITDFLEVQTSRGCDRTTKRRAYEFFGALFKQDKLVDRLENSGALKEASHALISTKSLRREIKKLIAKNPLFGVYDVHTDLMSLDVEAIGRNVQQEAPILWSFWSSLTRPLRKDRESRKEAAQLHKFVQFSSNLAYQIAPRLSNKMPRLLGLYCHSLGTKRRVLQVLHGLGLLPDYRSLVSNREALVKIGKVISTVMNLTFFNDMI
jgi:hypothetical protein